MPKLELSRGAFRLFLGCVVAITAVGTAVFATLVLGPAMIHKPTLFFCAVMLSSWFGGVWPGILASLLSAFTLDYYFIPPLRALGIRPDEVPDMTVFVLATLFVSWLNGKRQQAKDSLSQAHDELDARVRKRTDELKQTNEQLWAEIAECKVAEEGLIRAQAEVARVARAVTLGELAASIAHELNQPLAGVVLNANVCLRWLAVQPPDLDEARQAAEHTLQDGIRANGVLVRVRGLLKKGERKKECADINEAIEEIIALTRGELRQHKVSLRTDLVPDLPRVRADRIHLQQVLLNLLINAIEAMGTVAEEVRMLRIRTGQADPGAIEVIVQDSGIGFGPEQLPRLR